MSGASKRPAHGSSQDLTRHLQDLEDMQLLFACKEVSVKISAIWTACRVLTDGAFYAAPSVILALFHDGARAQKRGRHFCSKSWSTTFEPQEFILKLLTRFKRILNLFKSYTLIPFCLVRPSCFLANRTLLESSLQSGSQVARSWIGSLPRWLDQNQGCRTERACCKGGKHLKHWNDGQTCLIFFETASLCFPQSSGRFALRHASNLLCWVPDAATQMAPSRSPATLAGCLGATMGSMGHMVFEHWEPWQCQLYAEFKLIRKKGSAVAIAGWPMERSLMRIEVAIWAWTAMCLNLQLWHPRNLPPTQEWRSLSKCSNPSHAQQSEETDVQATVDLREMSSPTSWAFGSSDASSFVERR